MCRSSGWGNSSCDRRFAPDLYERANEPLGTPTAVSGYFKRRSYSEWVPIQNQIMSSWSRTATAR
ncbi:hypothetical protein MPLDJ20_60137 [Mesorhizobium plurifarium]|uniref:Uncharacterized protein n=1 Tax=Mesorhizobium plurifarium TaxID=69974 RepID=A0A090FGR4_MESPL|nr:hypothetical protein MPLDJ20_60137 [Mesorhizobium plurifarium]